jgi:hypothetical protein
VIVWSVVADDMCFKGGSGDEDVGAVGALVVVWKASVEDL